MKLSVSIPDDAMEYLDSLARSGRFASRSAAMQEAIRLLRVHDLGDEYESAWAEWESSGESEAWESTVDDGLGESRR